MNRSDYRKIGAKLKDLVPCVLISFEHEHILVWRGRDWKSTILEDDPQEVMKSDIDGVASTAQPVEGQSVSLPNLMGKDEASDDRNMYENLIREEEEEEDNNVQFIMDDSDSSSMMESIDEKECTMSFEGDSYEISEDQSESSSNVPLTCNMVEDVLENVSENTDMMISPWTEGVLSLLKQAVEGGSAVILDDSCLDADIVYETAIALAQCAPPGPAFRHRHKKQVTKITENLESGELDEKEVVMVSEKTQSERSPRIRRKKDSNDDYPSVAPKGSLREDELAKLLA